jgi:cytochrome oxidase Cu insertion factor (SCO1/SenC/PrrC family)
MTTEPPAETPPTRRFPESPDFPTGPAIGELLPDFTLVDQFGTPVTFSVARAGRPALVVFQRSTVW